MIFFKYLIIMNLILLSSNAYSKPKRAFIDFQNELKKFENTANNPFKRCIVKNGQCFEGTLVPLTKRCIFVHGCGTRVACPCKN